MSNKIELLAGPYGYVSGKPGQDPLKMRPHVFS